MRYLPRTSSYIVRMVYLASVLVRSEMQQSMNIESLGRYVDDLMNESLGIRKMQEHINILEFTRERYDGNLFVKELSEKISKNISQYIEGLRNTMKIVQHELNSNQRRVSQSSVWNSCCSYPEKLLEFDLRFKTKVGFTELCELVSDTTPLEYYQLPSTVLRQMKKNLKDMPFLKWQYVGTHEGVFSSYPSHRTPQLCMGWHYDPRYRPWYAEAASPEKKRVIILLDSSNSMSGTHNSVPLLDIAVDAIKTLLDSLTPDDRVGMVVFNDTVFYPDDCFRKQLGLVDNINKKKLKQQFLSRLTPGGQSQYTEGFEAAFQLLFESKKFETSKGVRSTPHYTILFITDGDATETHLERTNDIFQAINNGNHKMNGYVDIFSYGLGRDANLTLLEAISHPSFYNPFEDSDLAISHIQSRGKAYKITEPSELRNKLSFFYTSLVNNVTDDEKRLPSFSVPYVDTGGLGLIFTAGFPVYVDGVNSKELAAVVAIDISITELLWDIIKLKNDERSYAFVIDGSRRVLLHPLLPVPNASGDTPQYIHIEVLESNPELKDVFRSMVNRSNGSKTLMSTRIVPAGDCNKVFIVNQTYHWQPIDSTNFSLCFVEEESDYVVDLAPADSIYGCVNEMGLPIVANQCTNSSIANFRYHRLDLANFPATCEYFYQVSTVASSVVKFAPQCFKDQAVYEQNTETITQVKSYENMFNRLFRAKKIAEVQSILQNYNNAMYENVISDVLWSASVDGIWLLSPGVYIIRRYIATRTGMIRFYPGTNLSSSYNPIKRGWYELALAHPGRRVFSPPYKDAAGAGNIITISHTIHTPELPFSRDASGVRSEKVIGVMGIDLSLPSFYAKLLDLYPQCSNEWHCVIVDNKGYIILHKDYSEAETPQKKHITGEEGLLSQILLDSGLMYRTRCVELETTKYRLTYEVKDDTQVNELHNTDPCKRYYMEPIPNSNVFFVGKEVHAHCYYKTCVTDSCLEHTTCADAASWSNQTCECPCKADLVINSCISFVEAHINIIPCYPSRNLEPTVSSTCLPESLQPCYNRQCDNMVPYLNCSGVVGCTWCRKSITGSILSTPYCARTDVCYDGFEGHRLPGFELGSVICDGLSPSSDWKVILITSVSIGLFACVAILGGFLWYRKTNRKVLLPTFVTDEFSSQDEIEREVATIAAALGAKEKLARRSNNHSPSNGSIGRRETRRGSASSASSSRQKSLSSPQVVLSIVDGAGQEIARSLPRPVHIVRESQSDDTKVAIRGDGRQSRGNSTASIVIGSAGENSGFSSISDQKSENTIDKTQNSTDISPQGKNISFSKFEREPSADMFQSSSDDSSYERSQVKPSITNVLRSVWKKKSSAKPLEQLSSDNLEFSTSHEIHSGTPYYDMFAEPASNEGDIPIIQSDHSDSENSASISNSSEYISVCNESARVSSSSFAPSARRKSELWFNAVDHDVSTSTVRMDDVFYEEKTRESIADSHIDISESPGSASVTCRHSDIPRLGLSEASTEITRNARKHAGSRDPTERANTIEKRNFIVYV